MVGLPFSSPLGFGHRYSSNTPGPLEGRTNWGQDRPGCLFFFLVGVRQEGMGRFALLSYLGRAGRLISRGRQEAFFLLTQKTGESSLRSRLVTPLALWRRCGGCEQVKRCRLSWVPSLFPREGRFECIPLFSLHGALAVLPRPGEETVRRVRRSTTGKGGNERHAPFS